MESILVRSTLKREEGGSVGKKSLREGPAPEKG